MSMYRDVAEVDSKRGAPTIVNAMGAKSSTPTETSSLLPQRHGTHALHGQGPQTATQSHAVEDCMKLVSRGTAWTLALWCLGLAAVLLRYALPDLAQRYAHPALDQYYVLFAPFWIGDLVAFMFQTRVLLKAYTLRFLTTEQKAAMQRMYDSVGGHKATTGTAAAALAPTEGLGIAPLKSSTAVDMEYLPLVQRVVFTTAATVPLLLLAVTAQALACSHLMVAHSSTAAAAAAAQQQQQQGHAAHSPHILHSAMVCLAPVLLIQGLLLLRVLLLRRQGPLPFLTWSLLLVGTASVAAKADRRGVFAGVHWELVLAPFWCLGVVYLGTGLYIAAAAIGGRYVLRRTQWACLVLYGAALLCTAAGVALLAEQPYFDSKAAATSEHAWLRGRGLRVYAPLVSLWCGAALAALSYSLALRHTVQRLLSTQGYEDPVPLSKTARGWEPSGGGSEWWCALGELEVRAAGTSLSSSGAGDRSSSSGRGVRSRFAAVGGTSSSRQQRVVSGNSSIGGSASEESLAPPRFKREDSGLYDEDVFDKLGV